MKGRYLFSAQGRKSLQSFVQSGTLLAWDFDGTLTPTRKDPAKVRVSPAIRKKLRRLSALTPCLILTGRGCKDLQSLLKIPSIPVIGNHGLEGVRGRRKPKSMVRMTSKWQRQLNLIFPPSSGIEIENKVFSLSVHHRRCRDHEMASREILAAARRLEPRPRILPGKDVFNLLPAGPMNKGLALKKEMFHRQVLKAVYVGDDYTDEDVFKLRSTNIFGIHVGTEIKSAAPFNLRTQGEISRLLDVLIRILDQGPK